MEALGLNLADWFILIVLIASGIISFARGFTKEFLSLFLWLAAFIAAISLEYLATPKINEFIGNEEISKIISYIVVFLIFIFILSICIITFFLIAVREKNEFKKIFISGLGAWILFQSVLNLGASVYLLPITGIVLPFVSYGGTAMVSIFVALGIMHCRVDE